MMIPVYPANDQDYRAALTRVRKLMGADPATPAGRELAEWARLVEAYEEKHSAIGDPDPVDAIRFFMEERGMRQRDLAPYFGSAVRACEVLARKRSLTLAMIRRLHEGLGIPAELLIAPIRPATTARPRQATKRAASPARHRVQPSRSRRSVPVTT